MKKYIILLSMMGVVFVATAMESGEDKLTSVEIPLTHGGTFTWSLSLPSETTDFEGILVDYTHKDVVRVKMDQNRKLIVTTDEHGQYAQAITNFKRNLDNSSSPAPAPEPQPLSQNNFLSSTGGKIIGIPGALLALYGLFQGVFQTKEYWPKLFRMPFLLKKRTKKKTGKKKTPSCRVIT